MTPIGLLQAGSATAEPVRGGTTWAFGPELDPECQGQLLAGISVLAPDQVHH